MISTDLKTPLKNIHYSIMLLAYLKPLDLVVPKAVFFCPAGPGQRHLGPQVRSGALCRGSLPSLPSFSCVFFVCLTVRGHDWFIYLPLADRNLDCA